MSRFFANILCIIFKIVDCCGTFFVVVVAEGDNVVVGVVVDIVEDLASTSVGQLWKPLLIFNLKSTIKLTCPLLQIKHNLTLTN